MTSQLVRNGLDVSADLTARLERRIEGHALAGLERDPDTRVLVSAWQSTRGAPKSDEVAWIVLLELFREQFDRDLPDLRAVLGDQRMGLTRTQVEIRRQLGSRYFHLGRRLDAEQPGTPIGVYLLKQSVAVLLWVHQKQPRLKDHEKRMYHSQIATASIIVARRTEDGVQRLALLDQAHEHSLLAEGFGERSEEHYAYLAEGHLRRYALTRDPAPLTAALHALDSRNATTRRLRGARADLRLELGLSAVRAGLTVEGTPMLRQADAEYTDALAAEQDSGVHPGYLLAKRGQVRNTLYRFDADADGRRNRVHLDDALDDWLDPRATGHIAAGVIVAGLLDRARIHMRANNPSAAQHDREQARALLSASSPHTDAKFQFDDLERAVDAAIAGDDMTRLGEVIDEILAVPAASAIPAAALMRGCRVLIQSSPEQADGSRLDRALGRLEVEIDHPALSAAGRRHVAGHAALLSWLLARQTEDVDGLARTVELYRRSFDAVDHHPSVDALSNAATCSLALAKMLLSGDEVDAEQAASLLTEAVTWLREAFELAERNADLARAMFDATIAHGRLGEAALRGYPLTWNTELLDLAVTHLQAAREAGQHAVELTGLLGDAHYRRGVRDNSVEDLEQALHLKDEAFDNGNVVRENRSVSAAIALRLCDITSDDSQLTSAARRALQAAVCDPHWPWSVLQLASLATKRERLDSEKLSGQPPTELSDLLIAGNRPALTARAAELAVTTSEFRASILGGQVRAGERGVRIINDPHRLLEKALVLKRLSRDAAIKEHDDTEAFRRWLDAQNCPRTWVLPEPLAVVNIGDTDAVYVMSRAQGRVLGACVVDPQAGAGPAPLERFREALRYLAAYQGWRWTTHPTPAGAAHSERRAFDGQLDKAGRKLGLSPDDRAELSAALAFLAQPGAPVVAKKDPHPGNWLWTHDNDLVLIDLESSINLPLLQEAVTVIDDLPLLPADDPSAWTTRNELAREYCSALGRFGVALPAMSDVDLAERYEALTALHAVKGLGRMRHTDMGASLFSAETAKLQTTHYLGLLHHLSSSARDAGVRALAATVVAQRSAV
ncbi:MULTISPECIES: hypothetical protein [unclassified Mycobacterium]|uniref:hypothetical protein n=1 Tax=unclassified Mycobacterium TaxID=2642494 RepID=UPI0029C60A51|nr:MULTISPECIES: hypothetical protein [unclassified Mycobacterium]